jgi:hypothetical protein
MARGNEGGEVTERNRLMNKHAITAQPISLIPPDDLRRKLAVARPNENEKLPHIALMGDTYTVLLSGDDTDGRYCLIDMLIRRAEARVRIGMTLRNPSPSSKAKSRLPFAAKNPSCAREKPLTSRRTRPIPFGTLPRIPCGFYAFARQPDKRSSLQRSALPWRAGQPLHPRWMRPRKMSSSRERKTSRPSIAPSC